MNKLLLILITLILLMSCSSVDYNNLPGDNKTELDKFIQLKMKEGKKPGLSALVMTGDEVTWSGQYGFADIKNNIPVSENTPFVIASISKLITGTAIMQLVEAGKIDLEADVNDYIDFSVRNPDFPDNPISIRMLMRHDSGISMNFPKIWFTKTKGDSTMDSGDFSREYLVPGGKYYSKKSYGDFAPGQGYSYSNPSLTLLGHIIEKVSGLSLEEYTQQNICKPIGMENSSWLFSSYESDTVAIPYSYKLFGYMSHGYYSFPIYPAAFFKATASDLSRFMLAFNKGGIIEGNKILTEDSVRQMMAVQDGIVPENWDRMGLVWQYRDLEIKVPGNPFQLCSPWLTYPALKAH